MTDQFHAMCAELADVVYEYCILHEGRDHLQPLIDRARALLAQPVAEGPTDEELWEMYDQMCGEPGDWAWVRDYALVVLARWGRPTPQPVEASERLPEPEDCDEQGRCWLWERDCGYNGRKWALVDRAWSLSQSDEDLSVYTHWLPFNALPLPQGHEEATL